MGYERMTEEEAMHFLASPVRPAILTTIREDGRPHAAPVWYDLDGGDIVLNTGQQTVKGRNLLRDPRVALCVQDDKPPFAYVTVEGAATTSVDPEEVRQVATRIGGRYMGPDQADAYGARNGVPGELVVRIHPVRIFAVKNVSDP